MGSTNWRISLIDALNDHGESWADVEYCTLSEEELSTKFYDGYGGAEGAPFTLWTKK